MTPLADLLPVYRFADQREQCRTCTHCRELPLRNDHQNTTVLRCIAPGVSGMRSCSLIRADDGKCGPDAKLFSPKVPT